MVTMKGTGSVALSPLIEEMPSFLPGNGSSMDLEWNNAIVGTVSEKVTTGVEVEKDDQVLLKVSIDGGKGRTSIQSEAFSSEKKSSSKKQRKKSDDSEVARDAIDDIFDAI